MVDVSISTRVPDTKDPSAKVASAHDIVVDDAALEPRRCGVVDCGAVCGLLMERLQNVSFVSFVLRFRLLMIAFVTFASSKIGCFSDEGSWENYR
jgi:hypothetical protein